MEDYFASKTPFEKLLYVAAGVWAVAKVIDALLPENDTVNYSLYQKRQLVYHGMAYEDRFDARLNEHSKDKTFDNCIYDYSKPRKKAAQIEKKRILRDRPLYNKQHNRF